MRLLLDENLPQRLRHSFAQHEVYTARYKGWNGKKNGELLALMLTEGFNALITSDKGLQYQQNYDAYPITVFILRSHRSDYAALMLLIPIMLARLNSGNLPTGPVIITINENIQP